MLSPMRPVKVPTNSHKERRANKERRAKAARRSSRSLAQGLRSEDSPKKCRQATPSRQPPAWMLPAQRCAPPCPANSAGHGVAPRQAVRCGGCRPCDPAESVSVKRKPSAIGRGLVPISSEPSPSQRPWASAWARPLADRSTLTRIPPSLGQRRHFYFAEKATFLLCVDSDPPALDRGMAEWYT